MATHTHTRARNEHDAWLCCACGCRATRGCCAPPPGLVGLAHGLAAPVRRVCTPPMCYDAGFPPAPPRTEWGGGGPVRCGRAARAPASRAPRSRPVPCPHVACAPCVCGGTWERAAQALCLWPVLGFRLGRAVAPLAPGGPVAPGAGGESDFPFGGQKMLTPHTQITGDAIMNQSMTHSTHGARAAHRPHFNSPTGVSVCRASTPARRAPSSTAHSQ